MVTLRTTALLFLLAIGMNLNAQTLVSGMVEGTWESNGNPYIVEGNLFVGPDDRLTIKSGVEVLFTGNYGIDVFGRFDVIGTTNDPVLFTLSDTAGFASGEAGWKGISFSGSGAPGLEFSNIRHAVVEYSRYSGVRCEDFSLLLIENSIFRNNGHFGLALYMFSNITVDGVVLSNNGSGGMYIEFSAPQVSNFLIENNAGSGIDLYGDLSGGSATTFVQGEIRNNNTNGNGGGMSLEYNYTVEMNDVSIHHNSATLGGGIYTEDGYASLENTAIQSNYAEHGGGIYTDYGSEIVLNFCVVTDNYAEYDGGALYVSEAFIDVARTTIANNEAGNAGGGVFYMVDFAEPGSIHSSILWGNYPQEIVVSSIKPQITYTDIDEDYYGAGNIQEDPMFMDSEAGNYQLSWIDYPALNYSKSPCIDAGDPTTAVDPDGTVADMGAYSYFQATITQVGQHSGQALGIYPNPASSGFRMKGIEHANHVLVADMSGKPVIDLSGEMVNSTIDISQLSSGIYFVIVTLENGSTVTEKLIKE